MAPRTPRGRVRPTINLVSNKRQKSYSPSSSSNSGSISTDVSPRKRRRTFVRSEDELDSLVVHTPPRQASPELGFYSPSTTEIAPASDSDDENLETHAASDATSVVYQFSNDELVEDDSLQIIGETDPTDLSSDSDDEETSDVPVRLLTDFTLYNLETRQLVPVAELLQMQYGGSTVYAASGTVKPYVEHDDDEDDENEVVDEDDVEDSLHQDGDDVQVVRLSKIAEFDIHNVSSRKKRLDSKMYLRTKYAWYILDMPSTTYSPFFAGFWLQHRILHLVVTAAMTNSRITFDAFIASLKVTPESSDAVAIAMKVLGRELTEEDVQSDDVKSYLLVTLDELREQERIKIDRVPLIKTLRGGSASYAEDIASRSPSRSASPRKNHSQPSKSSNPEAEVLKHRNPTVVTPLVSNIAATLFKHTLRVAGQLEHDVEDDTSSDLDEIMHHGDPEVVKWLAPGEVDGYYESVDMDGMIYSVGDAVMVMPGSDVDRRRSANAIAKTSRSKNTLGNTAWFCRICYMYDGDDGEKVFHGQWYTHGSKTLLQETANPQSLFLMDSCEPDLPLASIIQKCNIRELAIGEDEPTDESNVNENKFYHGLTWIQRDSSLIQLSQPDMDDALAHCEGGMQCLSCGLEKVKQIRADFRLIPPRGFFQRGQKYHIDDYVYILPSKGSSTLYKIGRITKVRAMDNPPQAHVRLYGRFDDLVRTIRKTGSPSLRTDERCLFQTSDTIKVDTSRIDGKCYVQYLNDSGSIDEWVQHDDHYYVNQESESTSTASIDDLWSMAPEQFKFCLACYEDRVEQLENAKKLLERHGPLRGLELYSGAGGLGTGLDQSGFVETRWAVEFSPSAALTYQANHQGTIVFNQCSNILLQHAIDTRDGKKPAPLHSLLDGKTGLPPMPKPGDVDFVYGGPPCQSFSGANHYKKADDVRSTLVCNMLSYVEFYRPSYFLLENVIGLLQYPLMGRMIGRAFVAGAGIKMGVVKFIVRSLTCLGYQVRFKVLQAGQYGAPQGRKRVLFWGAKRGLPLPEFPMPTHGFAQRSFYHTLPTGEKLPPPSRSKDPDNLHQYAPLHSVTVDDAIGDLPTFDWVNPHKICKPTSTDIAEAKSRARDGIPKVDALTKSRDATTVFSGFTDPVPYAHKPLSRYQKAMRTHVVGNRVNYQYTKRFSADVVERVVKVPLRPDAFHDDLPPQLHMNRRRYEGLYGRMDGSGHFRTAMTTVQPNAKGGVVLHPSQKRIVTIQECARAQGFPDHYQFLSVNKELSKIVQDQQRQIGNAVPVPLALALGKSLGEILLKTWQEEDRAGSPEV